MGMCLSNHRLPVRRALQRRSDRPPRHISLLSPEFLASTEAPNSCWGKEQQPCLHLGNNSSYRVSYWVIQEDKKRNKAHKERIASSMGLHLNLNSTITGGGLNGGVRREKEETIETEQGGVYCLLRDHRMEPRGGTQATQVPFPADCQEVRVHGFFFEEEEKKAEEEDGQWRCYKDKVYTIGRGKKSFVLNALDTNITPYAKKKAGKQSKGTG